MCILIPGHLAELQLCLDEHCNKLPSNPDFRPASGDLCCAQFTGKSESMALNVSLTYCQI